MCTLNNIYISECAFTQKSSEHVVKLGIPKFNTTDKDLVYSHLRYLIWKAVDKTERTEDYTAIAIPLCPVNGWKLSDFLEVVVSTSITWLQTSQKAKTFHSIVLFTDKGEDFEEASVTVERMCLQSGNYIFLQK